MERQEDWYAQWLEEDYILLICEKHKWKVRKIQDFCESYFMLNILAMEVELGW